VLGNHTNTINSSLSDSAELRAGVRANLIHDLGEDGAKEFRAEEFNHIIKDEENKLHCVFGAVLGGSWEHFLPELLYQLSAELLMRLEQSSKNLCQRDLQLMLVLILFLEHGEVLVVEAILLLSLPILLLILLIILLSIF